MVSSYYQHGQETTQDSYITSFSFSQTCGLEQRRDGQRRHKRKVHLSMPPGRGCRIMLYLWQPRRTLSRSDS
jgi:hypothetical protein